jgi:hypothetical protein
MARVVGPTLPSRPCSEGSSLLHGRLAASSLAEWKVRAAPPQEGWAATDAEPSATPLDVGSSAMVASPPLACCSASPRAGRAVASA